jgi:hypothetical protein
MYGINLKSYENPKNTQLVAYNTPCLPLQMITLHLREGWFVLIIMEYLHIMEISTRYHH